uniref:Tripartite motif containing 35 n=1 Tax=Salvator merianae TaxID=96440 RepID=A0A8D0DQS9_SALMN
MAKAPSPAAAAFSAGTIKEELQCPICYEPFRDAVTLCCGHNFCKGCVSRSWEAQARHLCPVCKAACAPEDLCTNHTLANIVEMFLRQEKQQREGAAAAASAVCPVHREEAKLFCLDDKELLCVVCQSSKQHAEHRMKPVAEMAKNYRAKCKDMENSMRDKIKEFGRMQSDYRLILNHNKVSCKSKGLSLCVRCLIAWTVEQPEPIPPGTLIEVTKYLDSLQYNVWKKMLDIIKVVPFSFDPNTAASWLEVSDDLTSISTCNYKLMVEVPERFSTGMPCVLGSKGYAKGSHTWEVDVGGTECWYTGVARKSCGYYWSFGCDSRLGLGYMYRMQGTKNKKSQSSQVILPETGRRKGLKKVRVELDCDEGELSFYDAERKNHIYTFHDKFGEVFPYFCICSIDTTESPPEPFKICPLQVLIKEEFPN